MKKFMKTLAWSLSVLILLLIIGEVYLLITKQQYVNFLLENTVLKGRLGPEIDEYTIFENRAVQAAEPKPWPVHRTYNTCTLEPEMLKWHEDLGSIGFGVFYQGNIVFEQYWQGFNDSSLTNSWSMAKSIVSHLVGVALKEGLIKSVEDKYSDYLPEFETGDVTIEQLLTMSSGIGFDEDYLNPFSYPARSLYGSDLKAITMKYKPEYPAGEIFDYQSGNTQLLAFLVEKVSGQKLSDYASEKLWKPIGAEHDALWSLDRENGMERAFCCFNSNVRDFARFGDLYLNRGIVHGDTLIDPDYWTAATQAAPLQRKEGGPNNTYGYQWWILKEDGINCFYARGLNGQYIFILPDRECVIVRLGRNWSPERNNNHPEDVYEYIRQGLYVLDCQLK